MLVALPLLALGAWILAFVLRSRCWREASLSGAVVWGTLLVATTELLSLLHALTPVGLAVAWAVILLVAGVAIVKRPPRSPAARTRPGVDRIALVLLIPLAIQVAVLGGIALVSPPNTWDSMSYHMARLIHWQESASVAFYPAYVLRQLYMPPGAEFIILHLQMLTGGDHLAALVQWASMIGVLIGTGLIAHQLGARSAGELCAVMFVASVPIGVLESTSTQNDQVLTFWLVCLMAFGLKLMQARTLATSWAAALGLGASLGLAVFTKATGYIWAAPLLVWVGISLLRGDHKRRFGLLVASGAIALILNSGLYTRNVMLFGEPLGQTDEGIPSLRYLNDTFEPALFVSNVARDLGINVVATPFPTVNAQGEAAVLAIHTWLGVDVTDSRTTWSGERFRAQAPDLAFNESFASNPVHLVAIVLSLVALWPLRRALSPLVVPYAGVVLAGLLVFAAMVRWQPWHTRLELPFFALGAPLVAVVLDRASRRLTYVVAAGLLVAMLPYVVGNDTRSLIGPRSIFNFSRTDQYFTNWIEVRGPYLNAIKVLAQQGCTRVAFMSTADGWEYPLWALLPGVQEIEQIAVPNVSNSLATPSEREFHPCAVFALGPPAEAPGVSFGGQTYKTEWTSGKDLQDVAVMTPAQAP